MPIENVVVVVALLVVLAAGLVLLARPRRHRKPDAVIHIIRRDAEGRLVDYPIGFYDHQPKKQRK